jgi:hypothetical protein
MTIRKIIFIYLGLNVTFSILAFFLFSVNTVTNLQVAFWSSFFIIIGSSYAYLRNIKKRVSLYDTSFEERDQIDVIEDRFDLYSEINEKEDLSKEEIAQIIKDEKSKIKTKDSIKNTFKTIGAAGSIFRIIGYVLLVVGFFYLRNNQILEPISYLAGFLIVPIMALIVQYNQKNINFEA